MIENADKVDSSDLSEDEIGSRDSLDSFQLVEYKLDDYKSLGGRKQRLSDDEYRRRWDALAQALDVHWLELGESLETIDDWRRVSAIFSTLQKEDLPVWKLLQRVLTEPEIEMVMSQVETLDVRATANFLQSFRDDMDSLKARKAGLSVELPKWRDIVKEIDATFKRGKKMELRLKSRLQGKREKVVNRLKLCEEETERVDDEIKALVLQLELCESFFTQKQVEEFCRKGMWKLNPVSLANALASVPYTSCRASAHRAAELNMDTLDNGTPPNYELLCVVQEMISYFSSRGILLRKAEETSKFVLRWVDKLADSSQALQSLRSNREIMARSVYNVMSVNRPSNKTTMVYSITREYHRLRNSSEADSLDLRLDKLLAWDS